MSRAKFLVLMLLCFALNACSQLSPYLDKRRDVYAQTPDRLYVGASKPDAPAVCYNKWFSTFEQIQKMADDECVAQGTGSHAVLQKETLFTCKLLLPNHLYFKCVK